MPRTSHRKRLLSVVETLLQQRLELKQIRLLTGDFDIDDDDDDDEDDYDMWLHFFYLAILNSRYLSRTSYRSSPLPIQIYQVDLDDAIHLPWLSPREFLRKYRVTRDGFLAILNRIRNHDVFKRGRRGPAQATVACQLMVFLHYIGSEGSAASNAELRSVFHIGEGTAEVYRKRVVVAICALRIDLIKWPDVEERKIIRRRIGDLFGFPNCVGMVDGTLFPLASAPQSEDVPDYSGRKHAYSLSALVVCDDQRLIRFYLSGWPGSAHDNRIFRNSDLFLNPEQYFSPTEYIIGDSAFSNKWFSVTTYKKPTNGSMIPEHERFNNAISRPRVISEHTIGILKGRFPWLRSIRMKITRDKESIIPILVVIDACVVLHNLLTKNNEPVDDEWLHDMEATDDNWITRNLNDRVPDGANDDRRRNDLTYFVNENYDRYF